MVESLGISETCRGTIFYSYLCIVYSPIKNLSSCYDLDDLFMLVIIPFSKDRSSIHSFDTSTYYFHKDGLEQSVVIMCINDY